MSAADDEIRVITQKIRETESALALARGRRKWSNLSLVFGPLLLLVLYGMWWVPWVPERLRTAIYIPAIPVALGFCIAAVVLKLRPGYPVRNANGRPLVDKGEFPWQRRRHFRTENDLELDLARQRDERKHLLARNDTSSKVRRIGYKDDAYNDIDEMRSESKWYRAVNNYLQGILIVGSLAATGATGLLGEVPVLRWVAFGLTAAVGIASGFMGYFKYKERSFYLQQTADAIESEWDAVEIGVGRYKRFSGNEDEALAEFVEEVHRLKNEQKKRQQNLEQPPDSKSVSDQ
ncbi:SLATT domain-containing protein [Actinoplanes sp. NPDC051494]|uniref:SLATT domain-containing protein n=1 Tax=Actinoplanes sp. NPDC051494 TaxID=3363907 RepID=UPI00379254F4